MFSMQEGSACCNYWFEFLFRNIVGLFKDDRMARMYWFSVTSTLSRSSSNDIFSFVHGIELFIDAFPDSFVLCMSLIWSLPLRGYNIWVFFIGGWGKSDLHCFWNFCLHVNEWLCTWCETSSSKTQLSKGFEHEIVLLPFSFNPEAWRFFRVCLLFKPA